MVLGWRGGTEDCGFGTLAEFQGVRQENLNDAAKLSAVLANLRRLNI